MGRRIEETYVKYRGKSIILERVEWYDKIHTSDPTLLMGIHRTDLN